jgi:hypothetical protein
MRATPRANAGISRRQRAVFRVGGTMKRLALMIAIAASGCIPVHDYTGDYEMTYDVVMTLPDKAGNVVAGLADVRVREGLSDDWLVDLGSDFCRLHGRYEDARTFEDWPYLDIRPQPCWFKAGGITFEMSLGGTATLDHDERFTVVLTGTFEDEETRTRGGATVDFTESW